MRKGLSLLLFTFALSSCSPRDFLTRRLAADLIATSSVFRTPQQFQLNTGILSNQEFLSAGNIALRHHGWISGAVIKCPPSLLPAPCWNVTLTPAGIDAVQPLIAPGDAEKKSFTIPVARRDLVAITGIAKQGNSADVEFIWRWVPVNEIGAALDSSDARFSSTVAFHCYDDGWRVAETARSSESLENALKAVETIK